jgi:hypothetical protein
MDGVLFLASVVGIGLVMWWVITTDWLGRSETADIGLFAMRADASVGKADTRNPNAGNPNGGNPDAGKPHTGNPARGKAGKAASRRG